jgi:predicted transglutaminase-like cysteine proteinase
LVTDQFSAVDVSQTKVETRQAARDSFGCKSWVAAVVMVAGLALSGCAGQLSPSTQMPSGEVSTNLPPGYSEFCGRHPNLCQLPETSQAQSVVPMTPDLEKQLSLVNIRINRSVHPVAEVGGARYWEPSDTGDCKTYSVRKMQDLLSLGVPRQAMHVAILRTPSAEGHAVLTVDTTQGTYVLDNLTNDVQPWEKLPYTFWSRESTPGHWNFPTLDQTGRIISVANAHS